MTDTDGPDRPLRSLFWDLLEAIADADRSDRMAGSGHTGLGRARIGHDVSIDIGTLAPDVRHDEGNRGIAGAATPDHPTSVRDEGEEVLVVIDLHGEDVVPDDLAGGVTRARGEPMVVIAAGDRVLERVPLRHGDFVIAASRFHNSVLELRLRSEEVADP